MAPLLTRSYLVFRFQLGLLKTTVDEWFGVLRVTMKHLQDFKWSPWEEIEWA